MKHVKRLASLLLALTLVFALAATASAANTTISAPADSTRTYDVYQIFTGDLSEGVLSNVKWGKNGTGTEGEAVDQTTLDALTGVNSTGDTEKLTTIQQYVNLNSEKFGTVSSSNSLTVPTGYYLIKDMGPVGDGEAYSLYVVKVAGPIIITPKVGTTTSDKKVKDTNDSTANSTTDWQDSADYDIGDAVPFKLSATIAQDYANYTHGYKLTFHDKEEQGLTFNGSSVKVYVNNTEITSGFTVVTEGLTDGCTFEVQFENLKGIDSVHAGSVISVQYTSTLNENANIGAVGNKNTSHVTYTNSPNDEQAGENGKTPDDTVIVFTYKTVINKVKADNTHLTGAAFKLEKRGVDENTWTLVREFTVDEQNPASTFTFTGLDDGTYKLTETVTPAGYNTIEPIIFTITATHTDGDTPQLTSLNGNKDSGEITFTPNVDEGSLSADVVNQSGSTLPETGGMGTTLFYVLGGILAVGAIVLLVTKKRMNSAE